MTNNTISDQKISEIDPLVLNNILKKYSKELAIINAQW